MSGERVIGTVKRFDGSKGYGFIQPESGEEVFVHYSAIIDDKYRNLSEGERVEFTIEYDVRGPQAVDVIRL